MTYSHKYMGMTLNYIRWWGSRSGYIRGAEYPFITITPKAILTRRISAC